MSNYVVGKGKPPKHTQFRKGQSGNPFGAQKHNQTLKAIKRFGTSEILEVAELLLMSSYQDLEKVCSDKNTTAFKTLMASVLLKAIKKADHKMLDVLLNLFICPSYSKR